MTQGIKAARANLFTACQTIYASTVDSSGAPALVVYGLPGSYQPEIIVAAGTSTRQPITRPTSGTNRSRDKQAEIDVVISVYVPGTESAEQSAAESVDDMVSLLESYFRTTDNTLAGAAYDVYVSNVDGPNLSTVYDHTSGSPTGRVADATATVLASIRY